MKRRILAAPLAALALLTGAWRDADASHAHATHTARVVGYGQIRFNGAGPEKWAQRFRRERLVVTALRHQLGARLDSMIGLVLAFECIHAHEGSWGANTGNGFYGGLQFGASEWHTFGGRYATRADLASPGAQIAAGIAYHAVSGFYPWPSTARTCGLIR